MSVPKYMDAVLNVEYPVFSTLFIVFNIISNTVTNFMEKCARVIRKVSALPLTVSTCRGSWNQSTMDTKG